MKPSVSYCYRSGLEDVKLELPSPRGSGSVTPWSTAHVEMPELIVQTYNPPCSLGPTSDSQPCKRKRKGCHSLLAGFQHPISLLPAQRKPLGLAEHHAAFALGHRHRACPCRSKQTWQDCKLQVRALSMCKETRPNWKAKGGRGDNHRQFSPFRERLRTVSVSQNLMQQLTSAQGALCCPQEFYSA